MTRFRESSSDLRKVSTLAGLPPPLWGRAGERGLPHTPVDDVQRARARNLRRTMAGGIPRLARPWLVGCAVASFFALSHTTGALSEDGWQWRTGKIDDGRLLLTFSESEASDDFSGLSYYCKPSSGTIEVHGNTDERQRKVFADLVRNDNYPTVTLEGEQSTWELSHSDDGGWGFQFKISADGTAFDKFKKTGRFQFKVGTLAVDNGTRKAGLEKVSEFQAACRNPHAEKVVDPPKAQPFPAPLATGRKAVSLICNIGHRLRRERDSCP
jgi:hypothetical protein